LTDSLFPQYLSKSRQWKFPFSFSHFSCKCDSVCHDRFTFCC
jgi:hypothetical protein